MNKININFNLILLFFTLFFIFIVLTTIISNKHNIIKKFDEELTTDNENRQLYLKEEHSTLHCLKDNLANIKAAISKPIVKPNVDDELWIDHVNAKELILASDTIPTWMKESAIEFIQNGYVVIRKSVDPELCKTAIQSFQKWCKQHGSGCEDKKDKNGHLPRIVNIHTEVKEVRDLMIQNKKALYLQDFLYGEKTSLYTSLFFSRGTEQRIHIDIPFFWTYPKNRYFGVWTALEDVDMNNGPLRVLERGHLCNVLKDRHKLPNILKKKANGGISSVDEEAFYIYAQATIDNCKKMNITQYKDVYLQAGDTILWHPLLPHGGSKILDITRTRYSLVAHTVPEMVPVYHTDVFFDPNIIARATPVWNYKILLEENDIPDYRLMADFGWSFGSSY